MRPAEAAPPTSIADRLLELGLQDLGANPDAPLLEAALRALAKMARDLDAISRVVLRREALAVLEAGGFKNPARLVDAALPSGAGPGGDNLQGQALELREPEPWPEPVDGSSLLDDIVSLLRRYLVLPDGAAEAVALWTAQTYCLDAAQVTPRLAIQSPAKRCGKTRLLGLIGELVARPLVASNVTAAAVFRAVEAARPTRPSHPFLPDVRGGSRLAGLIGVGGG